MPFGISAFFYSRLPEMVATHWNASWEPDGYSSRFFAAFILPLIILAGQAVLCISINHDPKMKHQPGALKETIKWMLPVLMNIVQILIISNALGYKIDGSILITVYIGILFVILGVMIPKCKQNYTIGIKLPWTLSSEENWNRTHKLAGIVWFWGGAAIIITSPLRLFWLLIGILVLMAIIPIVYSFIIYKKA